MTKPLPADQRKRRQKLYLPPTRGTLVALIPQFAAENFYCESTQEGFRSVIRLLAEVVGRNPRPHDLIAENLDKVRALSMGELTRVGVVSKFKQFWLWCSEHGHCAPPPDALKPAGTPGNPFGRVWNPDGAGNAVNLSEAEGTLWHLCLTLYFPKNIRINAKSTRSHYSYSLCRLKEVVGHDPTLADLTDDNIVAVMRLMKDRGRAAETINSDAGRLRALWTFLAKKRMVPDFPVVQNVKEPKRIPQAWTREQMDRLVASCRCDWGRRGRVYASDFFVALVNLIWDTSERIGAVLAIRKEWINWQTGDLLIPAEVRKGQERDMQYKLHPDTLACLERIRDNESHLLFGEVEVTWLYRQFKAIRRRAGLLGAKNDRKSAFHCIRRSVASHLHAIGHNATDALGHASADVTRKSYLDPKISGAVRPSDVLFRPGKADDDAAVIVLDLSPRDAKRLPRAKLISG